MNRKGDWPQIFLVLFFFLLLVITASLLFIERDRLQDERPQLTGDLLNHKADAALMSVLRTPVRFDLNGDGKDEAHTLAAFVVANSDRSNDDALEEAFDRAFPAGIAYKVTVRYPDPLVFHRENESREVIENFQVANALLPDGIDVEIWYVDANTKRYAGTIRERARGARGGTVR